MTTVQIGQLAFMCAFFSVVFAGVGATMVVKTIAALLVRKMHDENVCPVCKTPGDDAPVPVKSPKRKISARTVRERERKLADRVTAFFASLAPEQINALTEEQKNKLVALGEIVLAIQDESPAPGAPAPAQDASA